MSKKVVKVIPGNQKVALDMEYLGTKMMRDEKALAAVINKWMPETFLGFFGGLFGFSTSEANAAGLNVLQQQIAESLIRWRIVENSIQPDYIVNDSQIPQVVEAGKNFVIEITSPWIEKEGIYMLEDGKSLIVMIERISNLGAGATYKAQYIGEDGSVLPDRKLLTANRALNYAGNMKPELSSTSQAIKDYGAYDMFNVTTTTRHEFSASGHALSTGAVDGRMTVYEETFKDGSTKGYMLPFTNKMIDWHLNAVNFQLIKGVSNFNLASRTITNKSHMNQRAELPSGSGFEQYMRSTETIDSYDPTRGASYNKNLFKNAIGKHAQYLRQKGIMYIAVTRSGGKAMIHDVMEENLKTQIIQTPFNEKINVGYTFDTYTTVMGQMMVMDLDWSLPRGTVEEMVMYNGVAYPKSSFDIWLIPIIKMSGEGGKERTNIRVYTKAKKSGGENINRGLVLGTLPGMTGLTNSTGGDVLTQYKMEANAIASGKFNIHSAVDGETCLALSEYALIVDCPDMIYHLQAQFPSVR